MNMVDPKFFINNWNNSHKRLFLRGVMQDDMLFGVEFRFPAKPDRITEETFDKIRSRVFSRSKNNMQVASRFDEFQAGILYIDVLFCNHGYHQKNVTDTLDFILNTIFKDIGMPT